MANGLKGKFISYTVDSGPSQQITIRGATKVSLSVDASYQLWTASAASEDPVNGQASHKQTMEADYLVQVDASSKQSNSEILEDIILEIANPSVLTGWIFGQGATWTAVDVEEEEE
jgi:hypothetical protein